jgi:hypothetical protein
MSAAMTRICKAARSRQGKTRDMPASGKNRFRDPWQDTDCPAAGTGAILSARWQSRLHRQFIGQWKRTFPALCKSYEALKAAQLMVVEEVHAATNVTYWFKLKAGDEALVNYGDSQVHVPATCTKRAEGDQTRCG